MEIVLCFPERSSLVFGRISVKGVRILLVLITLKRVAFIVLSLMLGDWKCGFRAFSWKKNV